MATEEQLREYLKRAAAELTDARRRLAELEHAQHEPIAVIGMACRFPGGATSPDAYWELLAAGRSAAAEVPASRWDIDAYYDPERRTPGAVYTRFGALLDDIAGWDAQLFGLPPAEALRMDPQQRLLMELMWEGLEDAGIPPATIAGSRTAVLIGLMDTQQYGRLEVDAYGPGISGDPYFGQGVTPSVMAGRLAYQYDLRGPTATIDTACSSSLVSVHLAMQALRRDECELAVAGGVYLVMTPDTYVQACATSQLSADGRCKTFDQAADGYLLGEGAGLVLLEPLSAALRNGHRVHAVLRGSAVNQDGRSNGLTAPNRAAQAAVIRRALTDAGATPDQVGYVETHGSGTALGDAIELAALHDVFGARGKDSDLPPLRVGAAKTNIGHTQSAAGVAGLIKASLALEHRQLPANLHYADPADAVPADGSIAPLAEPAQFTADAPDLVGVSSFGWSGTNAHVVLAAAPRSAAPAEPIAAHPPQTFALPISAASTDALREQVARLCAWTERQDGLDLADLATTLGSGRAQLEHRQAVLCTDHADAVRQLALAGAGGAGRRVVARPRVAFLLPGVGDEYAGLGQQLYRAERSYADAVDACRAILEQRCGVDLAPYLFPAEAGPDEEAGFAALIGRVAPRDDDPLQAPELAHPFLFVVEYALAQLLQQRGVRPDIMIGYSLGEYVAACLAGVFTLSDALHVVVERARLIAATTGGRMLAAVADDAAVRAAITASGADVDVAALNGPAMTVVSGLPDGVETLAAELAERGVPYKMLRTRNAFHSSLLEPVRDKLAAVLDTAELHPPSAAVISNQTGEPLTAQEATSSGYWADHLVSPVRFAQGVRYCLDNGIDAFVELGAGQTLGGLLHRDLANGADVTVVGTLPARHGLDVRTGADGAPSEQDRLLTSCAQLWELGVPVDWAATNPRRGRLVAAPTYPFQRTRFWPDRNPGAAPPTNPVAVAAGPGAFGYTASWQRAARVPLPDALTLPGSLLVITDAAQDRGLGAELARLATAGGTRVVTCAPDAAPVELDPDGPLHVAYLGALRGNDEPPETALRAAIDQGYDALLRAVQAVGDRADVRLLTVSRGAAEVVGADVPAPHTAIAHGLGRVARHEYPGLSWHGADLDPDDPDPVRAAQQLARELAARTDRTAPTVAAWRRGRRWTPEWTPVAADDGEPAWRADGAYLITGGTRGLGLALARRLVDLGVRKLALVSRTATRHEPPELDADVLLLDADTAEPDELRAAFARCREHFGELTGVVHAAGVPASGMLRRQRAEDARAVLAPKILALAPLAELVTGPQPPELIVLYSSAVTAFGAIGEGDYCAANTVLDAYGPALAGAGPTRAISVAWGPWRHDAWQATDAGPVSELAARAGAYREKWGFPEDVGCEFLDQLIGSGQGSVLAVRAPIEDVAREWAQLVDLDALVDAAASPPSQRFPRPNLRCPFVAPRSRLETLVAGVWEQYLGIDRVGVDDPFFDLGGNSLVGLAMLHALATELGTPVPPAVLFEHPTVAEIAAALGRLDSADSGPAGADLIDASADRGQRRRTARGTRGTRKGNQP